MQNNLQKVIKGISISNSIIEDIFEVSFLFFFFFCLSFAKLL